MSSCPDCGSPLESQEGEDQPICRSCVVSQLFGDPDSLQGSTNSDDYDILDEIGRGGDGTVYLATDRKVARKVAIKLINTVHLTDDAITRRFHAEADAIASLDHPNIIPLFASGEMDGRPFYTMKFVEGGSLADHLEQFSSPASASQLIAKVARGIHHAHQRGILHRDLKPSNILLNPSNEPYITDFGLAKRPNENLHLTISGSIMGTPAYMSPEQGRGENAAITTASDLFSIGSIFYQLLTNRLPFQGSQPHAILREVIEKEVSFSPEERLRIDRDLQTICLKCLQKKPENRYPTALALAEDLERWERGESVLARSTTPFERALRWTKRHPLPAGAIAIALLSLLMGLITSTALWQKAEDERVRADQHADAETTARLIAEENNYYANLGSALRARERHNPSRSLELLDRAPDRLKGFEWRFLKELSAGDQIWTSSLGDSAPVHLEYDHSHQRILLLSEERSVQEIAPETGALKHAFTLPDYPNPREKVNHPGLRGLQFSPDGVHYLFLEDDEFFVVDSSNNQVICQGPAPLDGSASWISESQILSAQGPIYSGNPPDTAWVTDLRTKTTSPLPDQNQAGPIAVSPDRSQVAFVRHNQNVYVHRQEDDISQKPLFHLPLFGNIHSVTFSSDNRFFGVSSGKDDRALILFDPSQPRHLFSRHLPSSPTLVPNPSPTTLFTYGAEPWLMRWDIKKESNYPEFSQHTGFHPADLFSDTHPHASPRYLLGHTASIRTALHLPEENLILTAAGDQTLRRWPIELPVLNERRLDSLSDHAVLHQTSSHNGNYVLFAGLQHNPYLWHRSTNKVTPLPDGHTYQGVLNDGRVFTRENISGHVSCFQYQSNGELEELWKAPARPAYHSMPMMSHSDITPDEKWIAVLHPGCLISINTETRKTSSTHDEIMIHGTTPGQTISISPNGKLIAATGLQGLYPRIYQTGKLEDGHQKLIPATDYTTKDSVCTFNHDGSRIYVGNDDGRVRVFDTATLRELPELAWRAHATEVTAIALSQAGDIIVTSGDTTTTFWSTEKTPDKPRRTRLTLETGSPSASAIQFSRDDTLLLHAQPGSPFKIWPASP